MRARGDQPCGKITLDLGELVEERCSRGPASEYHFVFAERAGRLAIPYTSGILPKAPNVTNVVLQDYCALDQAEHVSVFADPVTAGFVYRALDPKRAPDPPCTAVLPAVGAPGYSGN